MLQQHDITPKQWMKKYCRKDYIICDGMTENMIIGFWDYFIWIGICVIAFVGWTSPQWIPWMIKRFKDRGRHVVD